MVPKTQSLKFKIKKEDAGIRLDVFLSQSLREEFSRAQIQRFISKEQVLVNGLPAKRNYGLKENDSITIDVREDRVIIPGPEDIDIEVLYEDEDIIIVNKHSGIVVHPAVGNREGTLVNALLARCDHLANLGAPYRPGIVHRLDKETSGVLVVAKTDKAFGGLVKQFKDRTIKRRYLAIVKGIVEHNEGVIDLPIGRHPSRRKDMAVTFFKSKPAYTKFRVLKRYKDCSFVELELGTGRTHQIRVHMANIGHPILGDKKYGGSCGMDRCALHAESLGLVHPVKGEFMEFKTPLPADMEAFVKRCESSQQK